MADRFPSLEEFDSGAQTETQEFGGGDDFLSREKALLGDDANQFSTGNDGAAFADDGDNDLLGGGDIMSGGGGMGEEEIEFESSYPAIDSHNETNITNTSSTPFQSTYSAPYASAEDEQEPEVITAWRSRRDAALSERAAREEERKTETIQSARSNIDDFYNNYNSKKEKTIAATRKDAEDFLASREDTSAGGTSWERIAKLVDLSGKSAAGGASGGDKARFRELLMSLRKDEKAPGASGI